MTKLTPKDLPSSVIVRGRIGTLKPEGTTAEYGTGVYGFASYGEDEMLGRPATDGIYQMRKCIEGRRPVRMKIYRQKYTTSEVLQANRTKFAEGMEAWHNLDEATKKWYKKRVEKRRLYPHNLFISEYLLSA